MMMMMMMTSTVIATLSHNSDIQMAATQHPSETLHTCTINSSHEAETVLLILTFTFLKIAVELLQQWT